MSAVNPTNNGNKQTLASVAYTTNSTHGTRRGTQPGTSFDGVQFDIRMPGDLKAQSRIRHVSVASEEDLL